MSSLQIWVNGQQQTTEARSIAELCVELGYGDQKIATAVNSNFIPVAQRADIMLAEGDRVEILTPRQGG